MGAIISRRSFLASAAAFAAVSAASLSGCGGQKSSNNAVRIGSMPTEDILPLWVAEKEGLFAKNGVDVTITIFDSAPNLSAAITAGEVDMAMTDPMRTVKLCESGTDLTMEWITLGTTAAQGRFGVLSGVKGVKSLEDLAAYVKREGVKDDAGVGVAANTVPEYVFDKLCSQAKIKDGAIPTTEVPSLPDRYSLVASGKLVAGAFPGSMLALGKVAGLTVLADDTKGDNISQSVMVVNKKFNTGDGATALANVRKAWDEAAEMINAKPEEYRALLAEKANLNDKVVSSYPISEYPLASEGDKSAFPPAKLIEPQLAWMKEKGYSEKNVSYNETDGSFTVA